MLNAVTTDEPPPEHVTRAEEARTTSQKNAQDLADVRTKAFDEASADVGTKTKAQLAPMAKPPKRTKTAPDPFDGMSLDERRAAEFEAVQRANDPNAPRDADEDTTDAKPTAKETKPAQTDEEFPDAALGIQPDPATV